MEKILKQALGVTLAFVMTIVLLPVLSVPAFAADITFSGGSGTNADPWQITTASQLANLATEVNADNSTYNAAHYKLMNDVTLTDSWTPIGTILDNYFKGTFDGNGNVISGLKISGSTYKYAGLFGTIKDATIINLGVNVTSFNSTNSSGSYSGGLIGYALAGANTVANCYVTGGAITASVSAGNKYIGGLIGYSAEGGKVSQCYATVNVSASTSGDTGGMYAGGLFGANAGAVENCYALGTATAAANYSSYAGGLIANNSASANITNCYAAGTVSATGGSQSNNPGGLIGSNYAPTANVTYSYWNSARSSSVGTGNAIGTGCTSKTAANMKLEAFATLLNDNNSDPTVNWSVSSSFNNGYPRLLRANTVTVTTIGSKEYDKSPMPVTVIADYGTATFEYFTDNNGVKDASIGSSAPVEAGVYWVTATVTEGADYLGAVSNDAQFTITPRIATFAWTQNHYFYTNAAHTVSANVANLLPGDTCTVTLKNNTKTQIGEYIAEVVSLSNGNYTTAGTVEYHWSITDPDVSFTMGAVAHGYHVQGQLKEMEEHFYAVDIAWGAMAFDYSTASEWNPNTHAYDGGIVGWLPKGFLHGNNKVTAYNHSNRDVIVSFDVSENLINGVNMKLSRNNTASGQAASQITLGKVPHETSPATHVSAYLWLIGAPHDLNALGSAAYAKAGVITVTVEATESDKTPQGLPPDEEP